MLPPLDQLQRFVVLVISDLAVVALASRLRDQSDVPGACPD